MEPSNADVLCVCVCVCVQSHMSSPGREDPEKVHTSGDELN